MQCNICPSIHIRSFSFDVTKRHNNWISFYYFMKRATLFNSVYCVLPEKFHILRIYILWICNFIWIAVYSISPIKYVCLDINKINGMENIWKNLIIIPSISIWEMSLTHTHHFPQSYIDCSEKHNDNRGWKKAQD